MVDTVSRHIPNLEPDAEGTNLRCFVSGPKQDLRSVTRSRSSRSPRSPRSPRDQQIARAPTSEPAVASQSARSAAAHDALLLVKARSAEPARANRPRLAHGTICGGALPDQHDAPSGRDAPQPRLCRAKPQRAPGLGQRLPHDVRRRTRQRGTVPGPEHGRCSLPQDHWPGHPFSAPGFPAPPAWPATTAAQRALAARRAAGPLRAQRGRSSRGSRTPG